MADPGKRYQVFISSTYTDLIEERRRVYDALTKVDCIPAGMEQFAALDEEQFEFIKKVIDDCDYYLVIIGGRYGSLAPDGLAYTEKEYDYAVSKGIKVIALLHGEPRSLSEAKIELDPDARKKLEDFRKKVQTGRLVSYWKNPDQLAGEALAAMVKVIKVYPAVGWVRGDQAASLDVLNELNALRKENQTLRETKARRAPAGIAGLDDLLTISLNTPFGSRSINLTLRVVIDKVTAIMRYINSESTIREALAANLAHEMWPNAPTPEAEMDEKVFNMIKATLLAHKVIQPSGRGEVSLTQRANEIFIETHAARSSGEGD